MNQQDYRAYIINAPIGVVVGEEGANVWGSGACRAQKRV